MEWSEAAKRARCSRLFALALALERLPPLPVSKGLVVVVSFVRGESLRFIRGVKLSPEVILASGDVFDGE